MSELSRRKFFSFFGTGVAMLAKPDLFIPKVQAYTQADLDWVRNKFIEDVLTEFDWKMYTVLAVPDYVLAS